MFSVLTWILFIAHLKLYQAFHASFEPFKPNFDSLESLAHPKDAVHDELEKMVKGMDDKLKKTVTGMEESMSKTDAALKRMDGELKKIMKRMNESGFKPKVSDQGSNEEMKKTFETMDKFLCRRMERMMKPYTFGHKEFEEKKIPFIASYQSKSNFFDAQHFEDTRDNSYRAIDDDVTSTDYDKQSCTHTGFTGDNWWLGELKERSLIHAVYILNRNVFAKELSNFKVEASTKDPRNAPNKTMELCAHYKGGVGASVNKKILCENPLMAKFIRVSKTGTLTMCNIEAVTDKEKDYATVLQSSTSSRFATAQMASDGKQQTCSETDSEEDGSWWQIVYRRPVNVTGVTITVRSNTPLRNFNITVHEKSPDLCLDKGKLCASGELMLKTQTFTCPRSLVGRYIRINQGRGDTLSLCEVAVKH